MISCILFTAISNLELPFCSHCRILTSPTLRRKRGRPPKEVPPPSPEPKPTILTATVTVFGCPLCTYTSECRDELDRHLRRLHKMSLHNCEFCNKSFSNKYKLHKHFLSCKCSRKLLFVLMFSSTFPQWCTI